MSGKLYALMNHVVPSLDPCLGGRPGILERIRTQRLIAASLARGNSICWIGSVDDMLLRVSL